MPPRLALLLATLFCAYAYRAEARRKVPVSRAVWIPTLWMMRCASRGVNAWFGSGGAEEEGNTLEQVFLAVLELMGWGVLLKRSGLVSGLLNINRPVVLLYGFMALSVLWSPIPLPSCKQYFRALGDLTMALILLTEAQPFEAILAMFRRVMILLIPMSALLAKYFPEMGRLPANNWEPDSWIGVSTHKNTLGQLLFLSGLVLFMELFNAMRKHKIKWFRLPAERPLQLIYLALTLYLLNGGGAARSSTSILVLVVGTSLFVLMEKFRARPRFVPALLFGGMLVVGFAQLSSEVIFGASLKDLIAKTQGKDPTLAGRTDLWADVLSIAKAHPVQGAGFAGFWTPEIREYLQMERQHWWGPKQAHNGYIETYLQLGLIGIVLLIAAAVHGIRGAMRGLTVAYEYNQFRLGLLVAALIHNYAEAGFPRPNHVVWVTFLIVVMNPKVRTQKAVPRPARAAQPAAFPTYHNPPGAQPAPSGASS